MTYPRPPAYPRFASLARVAFCLVIVAGSATVRADESEDARKSAEDHGEARKSADRLVLEGKRLGDAGRVMEAIERFKAAEAKYPRAIHGCNIGLAYAQLKSYPQALLFLEQCRSRATGPLPAWVEARYQRTLETLSQGGYTAVEIVSDPAGADVQVVGFAKDETFTTPRTVWLSTGEAEFQISREGFVPQRKTLKLVGKSGRLAVTLQRVPVPEPVAPPRATPEPVAPAPTATPAPPSAVAAPLPAPKAPATGRTSLKIAGGTLLGIGALVAAIIWIPSKLELEDQRKKAVDEPTRAAFADTKHNVYYVRYPAFFVSTGIVALAGVGILVAGFKLPASRSSSVSLRLVPEVGGGSLHVGGRF